MSIASTVVGILESLLFFRGPLVLHSRLEVASALFGAPTVLGDSGYKLMGFGVIQLPQKCDKSCAFSGRNTEEFTSDSDLGAF